MEDYSGVARFILICVNPDHVIAPIQSRCHLITVPRPQDVDVGRVLTAALWREVTKTPALVEAAAPYIERLVKETDGNVTKALTVLQASLHALIGNHDAMLGVMRRFEIAQPDWVQSMRECVRQICQVSMRSNSTRHVYLKETLSELLKRRVPTEYIVRYLDKNVRKTLREQCRLVVKSIEQLLGEEAHSADADICEEERRFLQRQLQTIKCQLAGVCSDVSTACAFYETRSTKSQYAVIHINALALCLVVVVGLYQNSLALTLDADKQLRVCRPYSAVYELGRLLRHTMQHTVGAATKQGQGNDVPAIDNDNNVAAQEAQTAAQQMKQMCLESTSSFAGVDWKVVRARAKEQGIALNEIFH